MPPFLAAIGATPGPRAGRAAARFPLHRSVAADCARRAHVDAGAAADLLVAAVRADLLLVVRRTSASRIRRSSRAAASTALFSASAIGARHESSPAAAGASRMRATARRSSTRSKLLGCPLRLALEVDRAGRFADAHALAVVLAGGEIDLVAEVDRVLGADLDARVAARAQVEVDRIVAFPLRLERAQPAGQAHEPAGMHRPVVHLLEAAARLFTQHADVELVRQQGGGKFGRVGRADDEAATA